MSMQVRRIRDILGRPFTVRDLCEGYTNDDDGYTTDKVYGYNGKLNIRPAYQRNSVYSDAKKDAVIQTILNECPLNTMYWVDNEDGTYEVLDGQQRTLAICNYVFGRFDVTSTKFPAGSMAQRFQNLQTNLTDLAEKILDYELDIYVCKGTPTEKRLWFETINTAGEPLNSQELLNASHTGKWLNDAKNRFSRESGRGVELANRDPNKKEDEPLLSGSWNRQDYLKTAIEWAAYVDGVEPEQYMNKHVNDSDAAKMWQYFSKVIEWVRSKFVAYDKALKGMPWGIIYKDYMDGKFAGNIIEGSASDINGKIAELSIDPDITASRKGIYQYIIYGEEKYLQLRAFDDKTIHAAYEKQHHHCPYCDKEGNHREYALREMQADHIKPWSMGGYTELSNCQMLCRDHNAKKSNHY